MTELTRNSYAKVNIGLKVLEKRPDGYHELDTYFHLIDLHDVIHFSFEKACDLSIDIEGNESYLEKGRTDLMEKSARLFSSLSGIRFRLCIEIEKNIPSQAGLGGGSSNAASVLETLNELCLSHFSRKELTDISLSIGSDVPFFLCGSAAAHGQGRGEILSPIPPVSYPLLVVQRTSDRVDTASAFRRLDERNSDDVKALPPWTDDASAWKELYSNDFDIIQPVMKNDFYKAERENALYSTTSGSGSSQILIYDNNCELNEAYNRFSALGSCFTVWKTRLRNNIH